MTRDDIIRMAREAKIPSNVVDIWFGQISDFAALVAQTEREACAPTKEDFDRWWDADALTKDNPYRPEFPIWWAWEGWCAAIRARGEKP